MSLKFMLPVGIHRQGVRGIRFKKPRLQRPAIAAIEFVVKDVYAR